MEFTNFQKAVFFAVEGRELEDECDIIGMQEEVETHEPVDNFRPVDVMTAKKAGREYQTPYGMVVIRKNFQRFSGDRRHDLYIYRNESANLTIVGHGY